MNKILVILSAFLFTANYASCQEYEIEEIPCAEDADICIPPDNSDDEVSYNRRYHCPHRYSNYYYYESRDTNATWPGKNEDSFKSELMR